MKHMIYLLLLGVLLLGCDVINPDETIPTYVKIDGIQIQDRNGDIMTSSVQGASLSLGGTDAVELVGVFRLPVVAPLLVDQDGELFILPSVEVDGQVSQLYSYPFYKNFSVPLSALPGDTVDLGMLTTTLTDTFNRLLNENFEGGSSFTLSVDSSASFNIQTDQVSQGIYSGLLRLEAPQKSVNLTSGSPMLLDFNKPTYVEFDYKSNSNFGVSLIYQSAGSPTLEEAGITGVKASDEWNTAYVKIDDNAGFLQAEKYFLSFKLIREEGQSAPSEVYLDNVRVNATY